MEFSHCYNAYFPWRGAPRRGKVQGFCANRHKTLALEQSQVALKATAFKACGFVHYALFSRLQPVEIAYVDDYGESDKANSHWYQEPGVGRVEWKVKPDADGNWFIDED